MPVFLLDTNVVIALGWTGHIHHAAATKWLTTLVDPWATCPITECGFIRISSSGRAVRANVSPSDAITVLNQIVSHDKHVFWHDEITLRQSILRKPIQGHQQITDAYLLSLCLHHGGRLATFDQALFSLATTQQEKDAIHLLHP